MRAAAAQKNRFPEGVRVAELSALTDAELVPATLAAVLELPEQSGMAPLDAIVAHLQGRRLLIVLDTCEHLVDACAMLCEVLLREASGVCVLATSRQPLDVPGEHTIAIPPLGPDDALELFAQRAAGVVPGWTMTETHRTQAQALVARLDGIPLALELATMRLRAVPLAELVARLDHRFDVLTGGRRGVLPRHQTLHTAIGWSHELCTPAERLLWARLSVFTGPFGLSAVQQVCSGGRLTEEDALEALFGLVDKSVVQRVAEHSARYRMLDTIREYGADRFATAADRTAVHHRHFAHFQALAIRFWDQLVSPAQAGLHQTVAARIADIRAALKYAFTTGDRAPEGLWMATQLGPYWRAAGTLSEGRYWIDKGLELVPGDCPERAWGLLMTGIFGVWSGDLAVAPDRFLEARDVALRCGEERVALFTEPYLGAMRALSGEAAEGLAAVERGRRRIVAAGDPLGTAVVHYEGALLRAVLGDMDGALEMCDAGLAHWRRPVNASSTPPR
ncbi:hypothetical protein [Streptomyces sp. ISL-36]|uniref:ATP-binding protein n=1 Tax=Streptomyces sp. ISL-36 TaxID=2819182 RepID=UPI002034DB4A